MQHHRIQHFSTILIGLAFAFAIFYTYSNLTWLFQFSFFDPQLWAKAIEADLSSITNSNRWVFFLARVFVLIVALYAILRGILVLVQLKNGRYFHPVTTNHLFQFGCAICLSMIANTLMSMFHALILTYPLGELAQTVRFRWDFSIISLFLCGLGFCLVAWALKIAHQLQEDNESIV